MAKVKRLKDNYVDIEDPAFDPEVADPVETAASVIEAMCPDMRITEIDTDGVYLPRPLTQEEVSNITDYLGISIPLECYYRACYLPVVDSATNVSDDTITFGGRDMNVEETYDLDTGLSDDELVEVVSQIEGGNLSAYEVDREYDGETALIHNNSTDTEWYYSSFDGILSKLATFAPMEDSVNGITDDLHEGDTYNDGEYSGVVKSIGSDTITIESQNEDGDVVDIEIPINDSADMDQFLMKIFMGKKVTCPKTKHEYQIKGTSFYVDGKSTIDLPEDVVSAVTKVKSYIQKAKPISDDIHSYTDSNLDELFTDGVTTVTLGEDDTAEELASLMEEELANYQAPNEEPILLKGEDNGDGTATITVEDY